MPWAVGGGGAVEAREGVGGMVVADIVVTRSGVGSDNCPETGSFAEAAVDCSGVATAWVVDGATVAVSCRGDEGGEDSEPQATRAVRSKRPARANNPEVPKHRKT